MTQVIIMNTGPNSVKIEVQGRDKYGRFESVDEKVIAPRAFEDFEVFENQTIQILEEKEGA